MAKRIEIRPDIENEYEHLFGDQQVNGHRVNVRTLIADLTSRFRQPLKQLLTARAAFLSKKLPAREKYAFPPMDESYVDADGNKMTASEIAQGMIDNFFGRKTNLAWRLNSTTPVRPELLKPGLQGTGPADDKGMLYGAINTSNYGGVSWMWDWEDAGNDYADKLYRAWSNLKETLAKGDKETKFVHPTKKDESGQNKEYSLAVARKDWVTVFHRVPGIHLKSRQVRFNGEPVPATLAAFVIHLLNNFDAQAKNGSGIHYYIPKIETPEEALLIAQVLKALEESIGVKKGTVKIEMLNERARYAANEHVIMWVLRDWLVGPNVGRWDYLSSIIEMFREETDEAGNPQVIPDPNTVGMTSPLLTEYTRRNALLTLLVSLNEKGEMVNGMPIGGMAAVMKVPVKKSDPPEKAEQKTKINQIALRAMWFDKLRERLTGLLDIDGKLYDTYRQSWVATTDSEYVAAGAEPLQVTVEKLQSLVDRTDHPKGRALTKDQRETLARLGLLGSDGKITPHRLSGKDLTVGKLFSSEAWERLFEFPEGKRTMTGLKYAMYMASEYGFQQLNGNNAAAIADPLNGTRLMNDFATYEIFWHWLWTMVHRNIALDEGGSLRIRKNGKISEKMIPAGTKVTKELMLDLWEDRNVAVEEYFAKAPDTGMFDRSLAPVIMDILKRQLLHDRWIMYGSRVLLSVIEKPESERRALLDGIFAENRRMVEDRVRSGEWPEDALTAHDFVYDVFGSSRADSGMMDDVI